MHFSTSSVIVVTMALVCQLSKAASTPPTKATAVIFKCEDPNTLAACTSVYNRDDNSNALSFTFLPANKVVDPNNQDPTKNILGYNCIDSNMEANYCCTPGSVTFDTKHNKAVEVPAVDVSKNCHFTPAITH